MKEKTKDLPLTQTTKSAQDSQTLTLTFQVERFLNSAGIILHIHLGGEPIKTFRQLMLFYKKHANCVHNK